MSKKGEDRYAHVMRHGVPSANRNSHSVFFDNPVETANEAWARGQKLGIIPLNPGPSKDVVEYTEVFSPGCRL